MKIYALNNKILALNNMWLKESDPPVYPSVVIGTQTWMTESLSINDGGAGIAVVNGVTYYTQAAAIRVANSITGWHLPTKTEFDTLYAYAGAYDYAGNRLASTSGWAVSQGLDTYGFNAKPYGLYYHGEVMNNSYGAYFWASTNDLAIQGYGDHLVLVDTEEDNFIWCIVNRTYNTDYYQARLIKD